MTASHATGGTIELNPLGERLMSTKTVIVTGGSQGIGAGLVKAFLARGYNMVANSRNITQSGTFEASANLALVDGSIADAATAGKSPKSP
jgi:NAD(P)-dependent dehydrogenase (short-subunit alcohol dehydrogenase family)